jgi:hypothetical protein
MGFPCTKYLFFGRAALNNRNADVIFQVLILTLIEDINLKGIFK